MRIQSIVYAVTASVALLSGTACTYSDTFRSSFIGVSKFREVEANLYVSPEIAVEKESEIVKLISDARARVAEQFGALESRPRIIISKGDEEQKTFKLYQAPGKLLISPWGNYLILDHDLANIDVAAHELVHAEIADRLGYLTRMRRMPTWLDEGIALQVDYRPQYTHLDEITNSELERVMTLSTPKSFWGKDKNQNIKNYQSSKVAVSTVVQRALEKKGLYGILEELKQGVAIDSILGD